MDDGKQKRHCSLFVLDLCARLCGAQLAACDAARELAVRTHADEHELEARALGAR
jgi:hypothetical protein